MSATYAFGLLDGNALEYMRPWMYTYRDGEAFTSGLSFSTCKAIMMDLAMDEYFRQHPDQECFIEVESSDTAPSAVDRGLTNEASWYSFCTLSVLFLDRFTTCPLQRSPSYSLVPFGGTSGRPLSSQLPETEV